MNFALEQEKIQLPNLMVGHHRQVAFECFGFFFFLALFRFAHSEIG